MRRGTRDDGLLTYRPDVVVPAGLERASGLQVHVFACEPGRGVLVHFVARRCHALGKVHPARPPVHLLRSEAVEGKHDRAGEETR